MAYRSARVGRVFLFAWDGVQRASDFDASLTDIARAAREANGKLHQIILLNSSLQMPAADIRKKSVSATAAALEYCDSLTAVVEGDGVAHSLLRASMRGILMMLSTYRGRVFLESSLREALDRIARDVPVDRDKVRTEAQRLGFQV